MKPGVRMQAFAVGATILLVWAELYLTARADEPNTWAGVITDSIILLVFGAASIALVAWATAGEESRFRKGAIAAAVLSVLSFAAFWTALPLVFGVAAIIISRASSHRTVVAEVVGGLAATVIVGFMLLEMVGNFAPGLPAE